MPLAIGTYFSYPLYMAHNFDDPKGEWLEGKLWYRKSGKKLTLGITDAALEELGEVQSVSMPDQDDRFDEDEVLVTVEGTDESLDVPMPVTGFVLEINAALQETPEMVSEDPMDSGWLITVQAEDEEDDEEEDTEDDEDEELEEEESYDD